MVGLRPLRRGEEGAVLAVFADLSPASRARRYLTGVVRLPVTMLRALTDVDGVRHVCWVASAHGRPVGIARSVLVTPGVAEIAVEVADDHQRRGIASALVDAVTTVAAANGVRRVAATMTADNEASRLLMSRIGIRFRVVDGLLEGEGPLRLLDPPRVDRSDVLALARRAVPDESGAGCEPATALA
jgi:RimJ/RimL family protein N-acetyltransferase